MARCSAKNCTNEANPDLRHVDTGRTFCARCALKINERNALKIPWPSTHKVPLYDCACGCGTTTNPPQTGLVYNGMFMDFKSPGKSFATSACKVRFAQSVYGMFKSKIES